MVNFKSDNTVGIHPQILSAIEAANDGSEPSYGADRFSAHMQQRFSELFETEVKVFLTSTGTAANCLALASLVRPHELIFCHQHAHILKDEGNAPALFTAGAAIYPLSGTHGKIDLHHLQQAHTSLARNRPQQSYPKCLSLTQATESGSNYSIQELHQLCSFAKAHHMKVHMDGARFTNSLVSLDVSPAEMTWKCGIDVLSLGATKNGALAAEAVVFFNPDDAQYFDYLLKRSGQTYSKMRFFASQFLAYFEDDLWLTNAKIANQRAQELASIWKIFGIAPLDPIDANMVFVQLEPSIVTALREAGFGFYDWSNDHGKCLRFVTSYQTTIDELHQLQDCLYKLLPPVL